MVFTTYAQNFEDYLIWRALKSIKNGFYVDVGAHHPVADSVSKAFYEMGWRGLHIEPVSEYADLLRQDRPDEVVLEIAVGATPGVLELNVIPDTGLSTAINQYAQQHLDTRGFQSNCVQVSVDTLENILLPYADHDIHWLKIDVEGFEEQALLGWNSKKNRPWIMIIESTAPNSQIQIHSDWENILIEAKYEFVYFDGLNRYYVANEHGYLKNFFTSPIHIFDEINISEYAASSNWLGFNKKYAELENKWQKTNSELMQINEEYKNINYKFTSAN